MVQNLALPGGTTYVGTYSNFPSGGSEFTLPVSSTSGWSDNSTKYVYNGTHIGKGNSSGTITTSPQKDNTSTNTGGYYSYPVAAATKTKIGTTDEDNDQTQANYNTLYSICPRNWRLPSLVDSNGKTTPGGDFKALTDSKLTAFDSWNSDAFNSTGFNLFQNGYTARCNSDSCPLTSALGSWSNWWSSTVYSATQGRFVVVASFLGFSAGGIDRGTGVSIRCVVGG